MIFINCVIAATDTETTVDRVLILFQSLWSNYHKYYRGHWVQTCMWLILSANLTKRKKWIRICGSNQWQKTELMEVNVWRSCHWILRRRRSSTCEAVSCVFLRFLCFSWVNILCVHFFWRKVLYKKIYSWSKELKKAVKMFLRPQTRL